VKNAGDTSASNVNGILRCGDPDVEVLDSTANLGDIPIGAIASNLTDGYRVSISQNLSDSTVGLAIYFTCNNDTYHNQDYFTIYINDLTSIKEQNGATPGTLYFAIYPNPSRGFMTFRYQIPNLANGLALKIYDVAGRLVKNFSLPTARSLLPTVIAWDGNDDHNHKICEGIYFARLEIESLHMMKKIIFIK